MSPFKALNTMYEDDKTQFIVIMSNIANGIPTESSDENFKHIEFEEHSITSNGNQIIFGDRAVQALGKNGGHQTHVEAVMYYVINRNGKLVMDEDEIIAGKIAMQAHMDQKYGGKNRIF